MSKEELFQSTEEIEEAIQFARAHLSTRDLLESLAEEGAELSQAALKLIRACGVDGNRNVTPVKPEEAMGNLLEEIADVELVADVLELYEGKDVIQEIKEKKLFRLVIRLNEAEGSGKK